MTNQKNRKLLYLFLLIPFIGCISVDIMSKKIEKSDHVVYADPAPPFVQFDSQVADKAWENPQDGSSISYYSDCKTQQDSSLSEVQSMLVQELDKRQILKSEHIRYNSRAALDSVVKGTLDGVPTMVRMIIFKKNDCFYGLTYVALTSRYPAHQGIFNQFLEGFRAP